MHLPYPRFCHAFQPHAKLSVIFTGVFYSAAEDFHLSCSWRLVASEENTFHPQVFTCLPSGASA